MSNENENPLTKLLNQKPQQTEEQTGERLKAESDNLRRQLMDKKAQITILEQQANKYTEVVTLMEHMIQDLQATGKIQFVEPDELDHPLKNSQDSIKIIRGGINRLISFHEKLAGQFEIEFAKSFFLLQQQYSNATAELEKERQLLDEEIMERNHCLRINDIIMEEKRAMMRTVKMQQATLKRHIESNQTLHNQITRQLEKAHKDLEHNQNIVTSRDMKSQELTSRIIENQTFCQKQTQSHQDILASRERIQKEFLKESHEHNCTRSQLDNAKLELRNLFLCIESYHDNLKTQDLLNAEAENKKLQAVKKNEKKQLAKAKGKVVKKGEEISKVIAKLQERIAQLNVQINQTEQKLQTQMMRIPDFNQLRAALDRNLAQTKKYREEVLQRKYILDEIYDKNRILDRMEIEESKERMAQLKVLMPIEEKEQNPDLLDPEVLELRQKQQKEMIEVFSASGF